MSLGNKSIHHKDSGGAVKVSDLELWVRPRGKETKWGNWS